MAHASHGLRPARRLGALALAAVTILVPTGTALAWTTPTPEPIQQRLIGSNVMGQNFTAPAFASTARLWDSGTRWSNLEPSRDTYNWSLLDQEIAAARTANKTVLLELGQSPKWASANPGDTSCAFYTAGSTDPGRAAGQCHAPANLSDWDSYVTAVVAHCRGKVEAYETWNEANNPSFYRDSVTTLATMSAHAARIIHAGDPAATALSPSILEPETASAAAFVHQLAAAGGLAGVQGLAVHMYYWDYATTPEAPERQVAGIQALQAQLVRDQVSIPLWNTEFAFRGPTGSTVAPAATQQMLVARAWLIANYLHIPRSYYYPQFGYVPLGTPGSPAATAMTQLQGWYAGANLAGCGHGSEVSLPFDIWQCTLLYGSSNGVYDYAQIRWSAAGSYTETTPSTTTQVSYLGTSPTMSWAGKSMTVSQSPIYVRFTSTQAPGGTLSTPAPTFIGPPALSLVPAPVSIALSLPSITTSGATVTASAVVRRSDINSVIPGAVVHLCVYTKVPVCTKPTTDSQGRVSTTFRADTSTSVYVDSADPSLAPLTVHTRLEAQSAIKINGGYQKLTYAISPVAGQQYWVLRWTGTSWVTVVNAMVTTTSTQTLSVAPGTYRVQAGASSYVTTTISPSVTVSNCCDYAQSWPSRAAAAAARGPAYAPVERYFQPPSAMRRTMSARRW